jgi:hypothetical protein
MADIDWSVAPQEMKPGLSREEEAKQQQELNRTRLGLAKSLSPFVSLPLEILPIDQPTSLPQAGGLVGGLAGLAFPQSRFMAPISRLTQAAPAVTRPYIPSLAGSAFGTTVGTVGEQLLTNKDVLSSETGMKLLANNVENAIFDLGGNLAFNLFGKTIQTGINKSGLKQGIFETEEGAARKAAQEWLSSREGASLTRGQLTGDVGTQAVEGTLKFTTGGKYFAEQQANVKKALESGVNDVKNTLDVSDAFKQSLKQGDPTQMTLGDRWQTAIAIADKEMKTKYRPIYEQVEREGDGLLVDMTPLKGAAKYELDRLTKNKAMSSAAEDKRRVLEQILAQEDKISFSTAHDLRSDFLASARESVKEGVPATTLEAYYKKYAQGLRNNMDNIAVITFGSQEQKDAARRLGLVGGIDQQAGLRIGQFKEYNIDELSKLNLPTTEANVKNNELLRNYFNAQTGYKNALDGLYGGAMKTAIKSEPSAVGEYLFNIDRPERLKDVNKAIVEMQKYLPADQSKGLLGELQYGYINKMFGSPDGIETFVKKLEDKTFKEGFNYLFKDASTRKQLLDIANAAKYGLEEGAGSTVLRSRLIGAAATAGTAALAGGGSFLAFPEEVSNNILPSVAALGALYLTPKIMARALTNKQGIDALAMLAKAQSNPKYAGAVGAKIANMLNKSGIIDNEYLTDVNQMIYGKQEQQQPMSPSSIDWSADPTQ